MAGLEADTSSYNQPLPVGPMEQAHKIGALKQQQQQIESGGLTIDKQKLDLVNQGLGYMTRAMGSLGPDAPKADYLAVAQNAVKMGLVKPEMLSTYQERLNAAPSGTAFFNEFMTAAASHSEAIDYHLGKRQDVDNGQTVTPAVTSVKPGFGVKPIAAPIQQQLPVSTEETDTNRLLPDGRPNPNFGAKKLIGARPTEIPQGARPAGNLPGQYAMPVAPRAAAPKTTGPTGPTVETTPNAPTTFNDRFAAAKPSGVATSLAPGTSEAITAVAKKSGEDYAVDLTRAKNFKADLYPAEAALAGIKELGPQGVGPGTEPLNNIKSAIITWLPNADPKLVDNVGTFEQTRKYLIQIARGSGSTGTNDQLAAAFEASPSIKMSNAATENVLKSVIALRKMQHAQTLLFGQQNLPEGEYSKWISQNQNTLDPRAFGFDMMDGKAKTKLIEQLKKDPKAFQKFETSLQFAADAELIEPPVRK